MRVLTVRQPWAGLIVAGLKDVENRSRAWHYEGPLLILAGLQIDENATPELLRKRFHVKRLPSICTFQGGIIGMVDMHGCTNCSSSKWFTGPYGWLLRDARALRYVSWPGSLGVQHPPPQLIARLSL